MHEVEPSSAKLRFALSRRFLGRLFLLAGFLAIDCLLLAGVPHSASLLGPLAPFGIVSFAVFIGLSFSRLRTLRTPLPFRRWYFAAHLACILGICVFYLEALRGFGAIEFSYTAHLALRAVLLIAIALVALACVPLSAWMEALRRTNLSWVYAILAGALAWFVRYPARSLWSASASLPGRMLQGVTFHSVHAVLRLFQHNVVVDPANFTLGTPQFTVIIAEACSGVEGLGLVLVFTIIWLWYYRSESRFPQAILLIPCALIAVWCLNILRIVALICIGSAGAEDVAMVGFHSQAGWIAFTAVAFAFSMATRRLSWVRRYASMPTSSPDLPTLSAPTVESAESPATAAYLVPFLAILGATFVSKAVSGYFEWLYPLRFLAAALPIWHYRAEYRKLNWRVSWLAPLIGIAVFLLWITPSVFFHDPQTPAGSLGVTLAALPPIARFMWIAFRIAAATITVPIAEELAFRGYIGRRILGRNFDQLRFSSLNAASIGLSSVAFGLMHGQHWSVGVIAGISYALVLKRRGHIGDAIAAHATSNLLLAVWVLSRGDWAQW